MRKPTASRTCRPSDDWAEAALRLLIFNCCHLPTGGSRRGAFTLVVVLLLTPTGVTSWGSGSLRSHFSRRINLDLCLHGGVGHGIFVCYDQHLVRGRRLVAEESVLEEGAFSAPGGEVLDGLHLVHALAGAVQQG